MYENKKKYKNHIEIEKAWVIYLCYFNNHYFQFSYEISLRLQVKNQ